MQAAFGPRWHASWIRMPAQKLTKHNRRLLTIHMEIPAHCHHTAFYSILGVNCRIVSGASLHTIPLLLPQIYVTVVDPDTYVTMLTENILLQVPLKNSPRSTFTGHCKHPTMLLIEGTAEIITIYLTYIHWLRGTLLIIKKVRYYEI